MEDSDLSKYVTLFGDRIAIKQYCRNAVCDEKAETNKTGIRTELRLVKLRTKLAAINARVLCCKMQVKTVQTIVH